MYLRTDSMMRLLPSIANNYPQILCGGIAGVHRNHSGSWAFIALLNHRGVKRETRIDEAGATDRWRHCGGSRRGISDYATSVGR